MMVKRRRNNRRYGLSFGWILLLTVLGMFLMSGCSQKSSVGDLNQPSVRIGVEYGTLMEENKVECYPKAESVYVSSFSDGLQQLISGQVDALLTDRAAAVAALKEEDSVEMEEDLSFPVTDSVVVGISNTTAIPDAKELVNEFLAEMREDGTLDDMSRRWEEESDYTMPLIPKAENPTGTIVIGTTALSSPYTFYKDNALCGFDVELAERFAYWAGLDYTFKTYDWSGLNTAISTGSVDFVFSDYYCREDTEEVFQVSDPYRTVSCCLLRKKQGSGFTFSAFQKQFYNNFIKEDRFLLLLNGLKVTVQITLLSALFGALLGFLLALGKRSPIRVLRGFLNGLTHLIKSVPLLVLLLMLYYVIFKNLNETLVAVLAFSINLGAFLSDTYVSCIGEIDRGQWEVAQTLGFSRKKTFTRIILPQAARTFLPAYLSSVTSMMLLTSVVGYISLVDLTFAAQMIRTSTYNAVYTLLATAVIYFLLSTLLNLLLRLATGRLFQNRHLLKGLKMNQTFPETAEPAFRRKEVSGETVIEVRNLKKTYGESTPLNGLDCTVRRGEVISIIGPSGTGKSTLMRCISRLEEPAEGSIRLFGQEVSHGKPDQLQPVLSRTGMVFQNFCLFDHLTVVENVMISPMRILKKTRQEAYESAHTLLGALGLAGKELQMPGQLSGGQKQRVAIARALAMNPEILFFDEPTSALDPHMVGEVICVLKKLAQTGMTLVTVTHDLKLAAAISDRIFYLDQGVVYEQGTPEELLDHPKTDRCRIFVRKLKTLHLEAKLHSVDLPAMVASIDSFCSKYEVRKACRFKLYQIAEELAIGMILAEGFEKAAVQAEYEPDSAVCTAEIRYAGRKEKLLEACDENYRMNREILLHEVREASYEYLDEVNRITLKF